MPEKTGGKMKTKYLVIMFTMVLCIVSLVSCSSNDMEEFSIDEYADYSFYLEVENVGEITNADDAKHVVEKIFDDAFGFDLLNNMKPYVVSYDKKTTHGLFKPALYLERN